METSYSWATRLAAAMLCMALVATSNTTSAAAQEGDVQPDETVAVTARASCLGGSGRIDVLLDNSGLGHRDYAIELRSNAAGGRSLFRSIELRPGEFGSRSITGRPSGDYTVVVKPALFDGPIQDINVNVNCEAQVQTVTGPELVVTASCALDSGERVAGVLTAHVVNPTSRPKPYVFDYEGRSRFRPRLSATASAYGSAMRQFEQIADGDRIVTVQSQGRMLEQAVTVDCNSEPYERGEIRVTPFGGSASSEVRDIAIGPDGNPVLVLESTAELGFSELQILYCEDVACRGREFRRVTIDGRNGVATEPAELIFDDAGNPVMAFYDGPDYHPERQWYGPAVMICADPRCAHSVVRHFGPEPDFEFLYDPEPFASAFSNVIGSDGNPLISYVGGARSNATLRLATCANPTCYEIDISDIVGVAEGDHLTKVMVAPDGNPFIVTESLIAICADPVCAASEIATPITGGEIISVEPGPDGYPILLHQTGTDDSTAFELIDCADAGCSAELATRTALPGIPAGTQSPAMSISNTGAVGVLFHDPTASAPSVETAASVLTYLRCDDPSCSGPTVEALEQYPRSSHYWTNPFLAPPAFLADERPVLSARGGPGESLAHSFDVLACKSLTCGEPQ